METPLATSVNTKAVNDFMLHCKNSHGINSNYLSLHRSHFTVRNKGDLDSFIRKNSGFGLYIKLYKSPLFRTVYIVTSL